MNELKGLRVVKPNAIIEAGYKLTTNEYRIIVCAIAKVKKDDFITDEVMYKISVKNIADLTGSKSESIYAELDAAAEKLFDRKIRVKEIDQETGKLKHKIRRWIQAADYIPLTGIIEIRFSKDIIPYLTSIKSEFTILQLDELLKFTSMHSIRIYELLMQWKGVFSRKIEIAWLKEILFLENKYTSIKDFKKYVIDHAVNEINNGTSLHVNYDSIKTGRKITHLEFTFKPKRMVKSMDKNSTQKQKANKNINVKNTGNGEDLGMYSQVSKMEVIKEQIHGETDQETIDRILAERKEAS